MRSLTLPLALLLVFAAASSADDPAAVVKYRQSTMKSLGAHMAAMSLVVKKKVTNRTQLAAHAEAIRALAGGIPALFPPGTDPAHVPTSALPAVWQKSGEFAAAARTLEQESAKLAAAAKDARAFDAQFEHVGAACNGCHKQFRKRDAE